MSVWKDGEGRWHAAIQRGGKRVHRICQGAATWREAKDKEAEIRRGFANISAGTVPIADAIAKWLKEEVSHQKASKNTEGHARALVEWIDGKDLTQIAAVAEDYKRAQRGHLTGSTINRRLAVLRRVANLAYKRWGLLQEPLGAKIEMLRENAARERYLSRSELAALLRGIPNREARRMALVAAFTGLRRGELAALRPVSIQGDLIYVRQAKSGKSRTVPFPPHIAFALRRLPFRIHKDNVTHMIPAAMPGVRFHDLRHTAASFLIQSGSTLFTVGNLLGHTSAQTTKRYAHLDVSSLREAVAALSAQNMHRRKRAIDEKAA
jgi:integrase